MRSKRIARRAPSAASLISAARTKESSAHFELARVSRLTTMGAMTASIAHEINQPLAAISTNANAGLRWLARTPPDIDEVRAALERITNDAHRAADVIDSIRSMFKKDREQGALLNLNDIVLEVLALVHGHLMEHNVSTESYLLLTLPQVQGNRVQLQQVILNLIMNAVEAMHSIGNRARVLTVTSKLQGAENVLITVEDTGAGIDPENINRIFDAFFSTKASGMGMGLYICRSIIEAHGGRLWATPRLPYGSTFHLVLPIGGHQPGAPDHGSQNSVA
jgi:signal transduction histidine kinase